MKHTIEYAKEAAAEIKALRAFDRQAVMDAIVYELSDRPFTVGGHRKQLAGEENVWRLRVGERRVYCGPAEGNIKVVRVASVRRKGRKTTEEVR